MTDPLVSIITPSFNQRRFLEESIRSHAEVFQQQHPELAISIGSLESLEGFPERSRLALYRIYQQAMANIAHHARANQVTVALRKEDGHAVLEVRDDGGGFVVPARIKAAQDVKRES